MQIKSLRVRALLLNMLWSAVAVVAIGLFITNIYSKSAERGLQDLLRAQLYSLINSVTIGNQRALTGSPQLGDPRFMQANTGWYWMVEPLGTYTAAPLVSPSLGTSSLPVTSDQELPFDRNYERYYIVTDAFGNRVEVAETEVVLDTDGRSARFRVTGNIAAMEDDIRHFSYRLYLALIGFGVGSVIGKRFGPSDPTERSASSSASPVKDFASDASGSTLFMARDLTRRGQQDFTGV